MLLQLSLFQQCSIQSQDVMQTWLRWTRQHALLVQKDKFSWLSFTQSLMDVCVLIVILCVHILLLPTHVTFHRLLRLAP